MERFREPKVFLVGYSVADMPGIEAYLRYTKQEDFIDTLEAAKNEGVDSAEALVSMFAKLCYKSLTLDKNSNISRVRSIPDNIAGIQKSAHGSVFEHISLNFLITDCSRILTHELCRHRVGTAFSQTSGRYCRIEPGELAIAHDPILQGSEPVLRDCLDKIERAVYLLECEAGLRKPPFGIPDDVIPSNLCFGSPGYIRDALRAAKRSARGQAGDDLNSVLDHLASQPIELVADKVMWPVIGPEDGMPFSKKKKLTSAIRRIAPNGQTNEIAVTMNVRTLRHTIQMRTSHHSEWEIRHVFNQIYQLCKKKWPLLFSDAQENLIDGLLEISGMKMLPYDQEEQQPSEFSTQQLLDTLAERISNPPAPTRKG
jgi:thymidylate synthase ThyX